MDRKSRTPSVSRRDLQRAPSPVGTLVVMAELPAAAKTIRCADGAISGSSGRGACSHHGGIAGNAPRSSSRSGSSASGGAGTGRIVERPEVGSTALRLTPAPGPAAPFLLRYPWLIQAGAQLLVTAFVASGRIVLEERAARRAEGDTPKGWWRGFSGHQAAEGDSQSSASPETEDESSAASSEDPPD